MHTGPFMAASDFFTLAVLGRGGHAGLPHTRPTRSQSPPQVVTNLQHVVSRRTTRCAAPW